MKVKKLTVALAATAATALYANGADAFNLNQMANGCVVPNVIHNGLADTTAVGIVSRDAGTVYWVFFDEDSNHVVDGEFDVTENDFHPFIWANESGLGLEGVRGYLVFSLDIWPDGAPDGVYEDQVDPMGQMSANALQVDTANQDVQFVPVIPLTADASYTLFADATSTDYKMQLGGSVNLMTLQAGDIQSARFTGADVGDRMDLRYYIDNLAGGNDTWIAFWTADELDVPGTVTAQMYDDEQNRASVNFTLTKKNMIFIDVETIAGRPATFLEGFITVQAEADAPGLRTQASSRDGDGNALAAGLACSIPYIAEDLASSDSTFAYTNCLGGYIGYSIVSSPAFGAVQTLLGMHD